MDVIARPPESAGQAADAASAYTHVRMEHAPKLWKLQSQNVQILGHVHHDTSGRNLGQTIEDPVVLLEANLYGHPFTGSMGERQFEKVLSGPGWRKYRTGNADSCIESKVYSFGVRDGHQNVCKDKFPNPTWKKWVKLVDPRAKRCSNDESLSLLEQLQSYLVV